jgi:DNA-binding response OmpR family regulator
MASAFQPDVKPILERPEAGRGILVDGLLLREGEMDSVRTSSASLLLVEENGAVLDSLRDWIQMTFPKVNVIEAQDHSTGIFLSRSKSPDVVLMDISNLGKSGVEIVRNMKTAHPSASVYTLVGLDHESYHENVLKAGADGCACIWKIRTELLPKLRKNLDATSGRKGQGSQSDADHPDIS